MMQLTQNRVAQIRIAALGGLLAALMAMLLSPAPPAEARQEAAAGTGKIVFVSDRTTGKGVVNPQGDREIFVTDPNGTNLRQLTRNAVSDSEPTLSPDGKKVAYGSGVEQAFSTQVNHEIHVVNTDGTGRKDLSNNGDGVFDYSPVFSPNGRKIAFSSNGKQTSNPEGDQEIYTVNANGLGQKNLTNNAAGVHDYAPIFSPDGQKVAFTSSGAQTSNPEGDYDVHTINADGSGLSNFTFTSGGGVDDYGPVFSPDGQKLAFISDGVQTSNPEGDSEVYIRNTTGLGEINLSNNGEEIDDYGSFFSPNGRKIGFSSNGKQASNPEGDDEVYTVNADGSGQKNLTNNGEDVNDGDPDYAPDGKKLVYRSSGKQTSNARGDTEVYRMNATGLGQTNLTNNGVDDYSPEWGGQAN